MPKDSLTLFGYQFNQKALINYPQKMTDKEHHEKKHFSVPSRDQLIQSIKDLDQELDHVTLNLIKCDFNATENDIRKTFPEYNLIKVKNYNPGSFEVVFQMRIDAINFIKNHYDKKILNRRFFIKMGRQQKQVIEDWTGVGNMPRQFRGPHKFNQNQNKPGQPRNKKPEGQKTEDKTQEKTVQEKPATKEQVQIETKTQVKPQKKTQEQPKKEGKVIPKFDNHHKKTDYKKPHQEGEKKTQGNVKKEVEQKPQQPKKEETQQPTKKQTEKKEAPQKKDEKVEPKKQPVKEETPKEDNGWITVGSKNQTEKKEAPQKKEEKVEAKKQPVKEQVPKEDDGWITVGSKNQKRR